MSEKEQAIKDAKALIETLTLATQEAYDNEEEIISVTVESAEWMTHLLAKLTIELIDK